MSGVAMLSIKLPATFALRTTAVEQQLQLQKGLQLLSSSS